MKGSSRRAVRWGIWGTGAIAHLVAADFALFKEEAVLAASASRSMEKARRFAAQYGAERSYGDLGSLLQDPAIDAVYIASPNHRHLPDSLAVLHAGKAVLCEKPFAINSLEARQIAETARSRGLFCMEAMWTRFLPAMIEAKRLLDQGRIGSIQMIEGDFAAPSSRDAESRLFDPAAGGGVLLDRGVYLISLAHHLLGKPKAIHGMASIGPTGVDEQSSYQLSFSHGTLASLTASFETRGTNEVHVFGGKGVLTISKPFYCPHRIVIRPFAPPGSPGNEPAHRSGAIRKMLSRMNSGPSGKALLRRFSPLRDRLLERVWQFPFAGNGYQFEFLEACRCLREGLTESPTMPLDETIEIMETLDALRAQFGLVYPQEHTGSKQNFGKSIDAGTDSV